MSKQDRTHTRTAAQLEQKFNLGQTFGSVNSQVAEAKRAAASAEATALNLNNSLDQDGIVARLTNSGAAQGIFLIDGQIYINASYIAQGVDEDGVVILADINTALKGINTTIEEMNASIEETKTQIETLRQELVDKGLLDELLESEE
jgi:hypothetical protein